MRKDLLVGGEDQLSMAADIGDWSRVAWDGKPFCAVAGLRWWP